MIIFYRPKGKPSGIQPKKKRTKKNSSPIVIRDMSKTKKATNVVSKPSEPLDTKINIINACINSKEILEFTYTDKNGKEQVRNVEPQKITKLNGEVVLYAFCIQNEGLRLFILNNMRNLKKIEVSCGQSK